MYLQTCARMLPQRMKSATCLLSTQVKGWLQEMGGGYKQGASIDNNVAVGFVWLQNLMTAWECFN